MFCFVKPPWLSEVKRVVGIKKTLLVRLKTFRIWALSSRPTWPSWPTWKSFRTPDMRSQCQLRIKRLIVSIITVILLTRSCWISTCSNKMDYLSNLALMWFTFIFSASPSYSFCIQSLHPVSDDFNFWLSEISICSLSFMEEVKNTLQEVFFYISTVKDCPQGKLSLCPIKSWSNVKRQNNLINDKSRTLELHALKEEW